MTQRKGRSSSLRTVAAGVMGSLGIFLVLAGQLLILANYALFDADFFADRIAGSLSDKRVASYVADQVTEAVVAENEDLILVRPLLAGTTQIVVSSDPFRAVFRSGIKRSHQLLATRGGQDILLSLSDVGVILKNALVTRPDLAEKIPDDLVAIIGGLEDGLVVEFSGDFLHQGQRLGQRSRLIFWLGMVLLIVGVLLATNHELALLRAGVALTTTAVVIVLILETGAHLVVRIPDDPALGQVLAGVWSSFISGMYLSVLLLGGMGLILAATATAFLEVMQLDVLRRQFQRILIEPTDHRGLRLARGLTLVMVGTMAVLNPSVATRLVMILGSGVVAFIGLRELCRLAVDPAARLARQMEELDARHGTGARTWRRGLVSLAVVGLLVGSAILVTRAPLLLPEPLDTIGCNGSLDLCDRPLDQVVFACTHNAMGAADVPGWMFPNQQRGIRTQLQDGIRAFMLDVLPGIPVSGAVKTDMDDADIVREKLEPALGAEGLDAALRIRERLLGARQTDRDLYLCHGLCELGADRLVPVLAEMREFLILNPREVIIIIIEDAVPAKDIEAAFEASRLADLVYRGPVTPPWPTLGEMVDSNQRILVLAENDSEGVDWYHPAFAVCQETPYHFTHPDSFNCAPNRGGTTGSLLLLNHWITTPPSSLPSNAARVNTREVLLERVAQCERERGRRPNIIAVDFYRAGDLVSVVSELNSIH